MAGGGGRSRAATPFACGAGTLWRGFAQRLRMISRLAGRLRRWLALGLRGPPPCASLAAGMVAARPLPPSGWTESRCDSVCLRSRHLVAWFRATLAHDFLPCRAFETLVGVGFARPAALRFAGGGNGRSATIATITVDGVRAATPFACGAGTLWRGFAQRPTHHQSRPTVPPKPPHLCQPWAKLSRLAHISTSRLTAKKYPTHCL